jgi:Polyketide cyclase / dehydrase and lipid transport
MKTWKKVLLATAALLLLIVLAGFALPRGYKVERSIEINATMDKVYPLVYDPKAWARWGVWNRRDPGMKMAYSGMPAGAGAKWSWQSASQGSGDMEMVVAEFNKTVVYKITFPDYQMVASGRLEFAPAGGGVRVAWIGEGDMGANPLMRYMGLVMDLMMGPDFEGGRKNLKQLAEQS